MGREILVGERKLEKVDFRGVHSGELHGEWF